MKKTFILLTLCMLCIGTTLAWTTTSADHSKLPRPSREFLHKYFPSLTISGIEHKKTEHCDMLLVSFKDGSTMMFNAKSGDCHAIMLKSGSIPDSLLSKSVISQINQSYPGAKVTSLRRIKGGTCLGLNNNKTLCFDREGKQITPPADNCCGCEKKDCKK